MYFLFLSLFILILCLCTFIVPVGTLRLPWLRFFLAFSQLKGKCQGKIRKDGARPSLFQNVCVLCVCFVSFCVCVCVFLNVYCTTATGWLPNCSQQIYHIKYENTSVDSGIEAQSETPNLCYWLILLIRILFWALQLTDKHSDILEIMDSALSNSVFLVQICSLFCLKTAVAFKCVHQES